MSLVNIFRQMSKHFAPDIVEGIQIPMIVIAGESNSGGIALNSDATEQELLPRPELQILNNNVLYFEDLWVGVNNLIQHAGLSDSPSYNQSHSWELQLANKAADGEFGTPPIYLVKTGQGGSRIAQWNEGGEYYTKFCERVDSAIYELSITGTRPFSMFYTQGINDAIAGTDLTTWKNATVAHFAKIRTRYGADIPIFMTKFMASWAAYSNAVEEVCGMVGNCWFVETDDLPLFPDGNHWTYAGQKEIANRLVAKLNAEGYTIVSNDSL